MSLRSKQALILFIATLVPFALGGAAVNFVVAPAYRGVVSRAAVTESQRLAEHVAWNLTREVDRLEKLATWTELRRLVRSPSRPASRSNEIARAWPRLSASDPVVRGVLTNEVSNELMWWQSTDPSVREVLVTDADGHVVASSGKPRAFVFRRQSWWQYAFNGGSGGVYVSDVFGEPSGAYVIEVAVPVHADGTVSSAVVGVLRAELDAQQVFSDLKRAAAGEDVVAFLLDGRGRVILSPTSGRPLTRTLKEPDLKLMRAQPAGTARSRDRSHLLAWAAAPLDEQLQPLRARVPRLHVVTTRSTGAAFAPLHAVQAWMLGIAAVTVIAIVTVGSWMADALVVRHVRKLAAGMRELAAGNFDEAAAIAEQLTRHHQHTGDGVRAVGVELLESLAPQDEDTLDENRHPAGGDHGGAQDPISAASKQ